MSESSKAACWAEYSDEYWVDLKVLWRAQRTVDYLVLTLVGQTGQMTGLRRVVWKDVSLVASTGTRWGLYLAVHLAGHWDEQTVAWLVDHLVAPKGSKMATKMVDAMGEKRVEQKAVSKA